MGWNETVKSFDKYLNFLLHCFVFKTTIIKILHITVLQCVTKQICRIAKIGHLGVFRC